MHLIDILYHFLKTTDAGKKFLSAEQVQNAVYNAHNVAFDVQKMNEFFPFDDVEAVLVSKPQEIQACLAMALSRIANEAHPYLENPIMLQPMFYNLSHSIDFGEVKSSVVGQLVSVEGHVVRASLTKPLLASGHFKCPKCKQLSSAIFEDGVFNPPVQCSTKK